MFTIFLAEGTKLALIKAAQNIAIYSAIYAGKRAIRKKRKKEKEG